ncbi:MAG: uroporphyrinogen-III synthase [Bacteroidales bacterium]|nr:uroporphyrinogen-III synthase [Bacteroidales bacterium]
MIVSCQKEDSFPRFQKALQQHGLTAVNLPVITTQTVKPDINTLNIIDNLSAYDYIIITSAAGVDTFNYLINSTKGTINKTSLQIISVGKKTSEKLKIKGFNVAIENPGTTAADLAEYLINSNLINGKKILQAKGDNASPIIKERLENVCNFTQITVYQTIAIKNHDSEIISLINSNKAKGFVFSSPSEFRSFLNIEKIANFATDTVIFCIGKTTAEFIKNQGFTNVLTSPEPNFEILAEYIANTFKTL